MKLIFVLEVEVDEAEAKSLGEKRQKMHLLKRSIPDHVEMLTVDALRGKLFPVVSCKPLQPTVFTTLPPDMQVTGGDVV